MLLIDAKALYERIKEHHDLYVNAWGGFKNLPANDKARVDAYTCCIAEVMNSPTIDAVPVVRCKDCKHWGMLEGPPETEHIKCCELGQYMVGANGYCVYGEVKKHD